VLKAQRFEVITSELEKHGIVSIDELTKKLNTSRSTIRRDIEELEMKNSLKRIHGGAVSTKEASSQEPPFQVRKDIQLDEKRRIAEAACKLVGENQTLFISGGTTGHEFAKALKSIPFSLYIATNDLMAAVELSTLSNIDLMVLGGLLRRHHFSLNGFFTEEMISRTHADKAFIGVDAVDFNIGFMNFSAEEIQPKKLMIEASREVIVLCDHSKFDKVAFVNICSFRNVDLVITGKEADPKVIDRLEKTGVKVMVV
jgi:DeoR/GlpR family transcriptional regulator of sugar metabolism